MILKHFGVGRLDPERQLLQLCDFGNEVRTVYVGSPNSLYAGQVVGSGPSYYADDWEAALNGRLPPSYVAGRRQERLKRIQEWREKRRKK